MKLLEHLAAAAAGAIIAMLAVLVLLLPVQPAAATVTAASSQASHTHLWWDGATCRAFGHGRLAAMVRDSRHADTYLRADVALWAHDTHRHASRHTLQLDRGYVGLDCAGSYGL